MASGQSVESREAADQGRLDLESIVLLMLIGIVGLVPVAVALVHGLDFGAGEAIGLILVAFAVWGSLRELFGRRR